MKLTKEEEQEKKKKKQNQFFLKFGGTKVSLASLHYLFSFPKPYLLMFKKGQKPTLINE